MLVAVAAAVTTLMMVMLPSTASAEPSPGDVRAERTADVAADRELDFAVRGTPPSRDEMKCAATSEPGTMEVCYEPAGDRWWVQDLESDGASALVYWFNYRDSGASPYREGFCVNSLGKGVWGQCNKDYYENSRLEGYLCTWDRGSGGIVDHARCNNNSHTTFQ
jgi:hypothetical protein